MSKVFDGKKFRIGVLMGGKSVEREVSFNSGRTVCDHIDVNRYEIVPIFQTVAGKLYILPWQFLHRGKITDFECRLKSEAQEIVWDDLRQFVDFIFIAVHGRYAEDGTMQGMLEVLGIPYLGSKVFGSACGINKVFQKRLLAMYGIAVPRDVVLTPNQVKNLSSEDIVAKLKEEGVIHSSDEFSPCIVKPVFEGSSVGITVVLKSDDLWEALKRACWKDVTVEQPVLVEEFVSGMEFTCIGLETNEKLGFVGQDAWQALSITEVIHEEGTFFHDYEQKYMPGRSTKVTPARCSDTDSEVIKKACIKVARALGFGTFFRIDGFLTRDNRVIVTDPNTLSGMGPASFLFHQAAEIGMNHTDLINYIINCELDKYNLLDDVILNQTTGGFNPHHTNLSRSAEGGNIFVEDGKKLRVAVLLGGDSNEREISLESGRNVCYKLSPSKYDVLPVFVDRNMRLYKLSPRLLIQNSTREIAELVDEEIEIKWSDLQQICDFVFIALHGGKGENGSVQGTIEMLGLPYNGPGVLASSLCMDKYRTNNFLSQRGFCIPRSFLLAKDEFDLLDDLLKKVSSDDGEFIPLIVKPHDDGCSMYVKKVTNRQELEETLKTFFATEKKLALVEECLDGMELTCGVLGNHDNEAEVVALPPSQAVASDGILSIKEKFLPGAGENQTPAPLPEDKLKLVQDTVKRAYIELGCDGYSRIDCFYQSATDKVIILEVNTLPGLTPATCIFHQAAEVGMKPMEFIDRIVRLGLERHKMLRVELPRQTIEKEK